MEAASATGSVIVYTHLPTLLGAKRPFLFVIHGRPTGTVLFASRVVDTGADQG